jgi:hypothetical protein
LRTTLRVLGDICLFEWRVTRLSVEMMSSWILYNQG